MRVKIADDLLCSAYRTVLSPMTGLPVRLRCELDAKHSGSHMLQVRVIWGDDGKDRTTMLTKEEIAEAVQDLDWQAFRSELRGLSTRDKMERLASWKENHPGRRAEIQVENYMNALKRAGILDLNGKAKKR